jgi:hypothetical protein
MGQMCRLCCYDGHCPAHGTYVFCKSCNRYKTTHCINELCEYCCKSTDCKVHFSNEPGPLCETCSYFEADADCWVKKCRACCKDPDCYHRNPQYCTNCNFHADDNCPIVNCQYCCNCRQCPVHSHLTEWCSACDSRRKSKKCILERCIYCCDFPDCADHKEKRYLFRVKFAMNGLGHKYTNIYISTQHRDSSNTLQNRSKLVNK